MDKNFKQRGTGKQYRPDVRWWLAEGMHTDQTLKNEMRMLDDMGMGAIEFLCHGGSRRGLEALRLGGGRVGARYPYAGEGVGGPPDGRVYDQRN